MHAWQPRVDVLFSPAAEQRADTVSPFPMRRSLTKTEIIRKQQDIDRIFRQGKSFSCKGMRLIAIRNDLSFDRFIVIPAKHYGNAVERNKVRRRAKEIFRLYPGRKLMTAADETNGLDIVLVVYPGKIPGFSLLESQFTSLLDKISRE